MSNDRSRIAFASCMVLFMGRSETVLQRREVALPDGEKMRHKSEVTCLRSLSGRAETNTLLL